MPTINEACETVVRESPLNATRYDTGTPSNEAARTQPHSLPAKRGRSKKMNGSSPAHANAKRNKTMVPTGISLSAILPKKNPVPHRHPAVARARMGMTRPCGSNIASDCRAGVNEHQLSTVRNFIRLQYRLARVRGTQVGNECRTAARAETKGYARAYRRAFDSQPRDHSGSAVGCPARRKCALAARFQQWSVQRPSVTISNRNAGRSIRSGISKDRDWGFVRCQSIRQRPPATGIPARSGSP